MEQQQEQHYVIDVMEEQLNYEHEVTRLVQDPNNSPFCWLMVIKRYDNVEHRDLDNQLVVISANLINKGIDMELARPLPLHVPRCRLEGVPFGYFANIAAVTNKHSYLTQHIMKFLKLYFNTDEKQKPPEIQRVLPTLGESLNLKYDLTPESMDLWVLVCCEDKGKKSFEIHSLSQISRSGNKTYYDELELCEVTIMPTNSNDKENTAKNIPAENKKREGRIVAMSRYREYLERNIAWLTKRFALKVRIQESGPFILEQKIGYDEIMEEFYQTAIDEQYKHLDKFRCRLVERVEKRRKIMNASNLISIIVEHVGRELRRFDRQREKYDPNFNYLSGYLIRYSCIYGSIVERVLSFLTGTGVDLLDSKMLRLALNAQINIETLNKLYIPSLVDILKDLVHNDIVPSAFPKRKNKSLEVIADTRRKDHDQTQDHGNEKPCARRRASI